MTSTERKIEDIRKAFIAMPVGSCGVKWDRVVWRVSESGWIVGEEGVRKDALIHTLESAVSWMAWKRGIPMESAAA